MIGMSVDTMSIIFQVMILTGVAIGGGTLLWALTLGRHKVGPNLDHALIGCRGPGYCQHPKCKNNPSNQK